MKQWGPGIDPEAQYAAADHTVPAWVVLPDGAKTPSHIDYLATGLPIRYAVEYLPWDSSPPPVRWDLIRVEEYSVLSVLFRVRGYILWPRLLADVVLGAVASFMLLRCVPITRGIIAWRRRRRGACEGCGYQLAGLTKCPECGVDLADRDHRTAA